ncbi:hypothetical protein C4580_06100 [Candidatus Woesearchaeota archaeon]|nr:MAG: hypothetical protein C4580_06100 [Candidatus Woesearchaeota archaeon]
MYAVLTLAIVLSALGSSLMTRAASTRDMQDMDVMMSSMQGVMGSMQSMIEQCEERMGAGMGEMMTGMMDTNTAMAKPEGMSQEEHESHHR